MGRILPLVALSALLLGCAAPSPSPTPAMPGADPSDPAATESAFHAPEHAAATPATPSPPPPPPPAPGQAVYVCPMHPDVTSAEPGRCPRCGMNLVLKESRQ